MIFKYNTADLFQINNIFHLLLFLFPNTTLRTCFRYTISSTCYCSCFSVIALAHNDCVCSAFALCYCAESASRCTANTASGSATVQRVPFAAQPTLPQALLLCREYLSLHSQHCLRLCYCAEYLSLHSQHCLRLSPHASTVPRIPQSTAHKVDSST